MLVINGVVYTLSNHALDQQAKRNIPDDWIRQTIAKPDKEPEYDAERDNYRYDRTFWLNNRMHPVRVIVNHNTRMIITVMYRD